MLKKKLCDRYIVNTKKSNINADFLVYMIYVYIHLMLIVFSQVFFTITCSGSHTHTRTFTHTISHYYRAYIHI